MKSLIFQENIHWRDFYGLTKSLSVDPVSICIYRGYCTSLGFPRVYYIFTIPYTRLGLYIFFYLYMII